jgi:acyl-coenzyme A thioesterase PaaI-like protein
MSEPSVDSPDAQPEKSGDPLFDAAAALRDLVNVFTDRELDDAMLAEITAVAEDLTARASKAPHWDRQALLEASINEPDRTDGRRGGFYYRAIAGPANPAALPLDLHFGTDEVTTEITLRPMHSGAPGRGHGGVLAGILDEFAGTAPHLVGAMAATARLTVNYRAPIPVGEPLALRVWIHEQVGRKIYVHGDVRRGDTRIADVEGLFIVIDYAGIDTSGAARH